MINVITSRNNDKVKYATSLKESKYREKYQQFLGESRKSLELAIKANLVSDVFTFEALDIPDNINQYLVDDKVMEKLSNYKNPEGVVFIANYPKFKKDNLNKILYLENINDPGNLGTMIRTALAFNFDAVVTSDNSVSFYNEKVLSAAKGANYLIPTFKAKIDEINAGHKVIATCLCKDAISVNELEKYDKFILVMGNEANGISKIVEESADIKVIIPIKNIDSLNVSIAAGILMQKLGD